MKRQILIGSLILLFIQTLASAGVLYVPSRDYPTIQSAINDAVNGDVVVVAPGIWTGPGNVDLDFGGKAITVRSEINPDNPDPGIIAATIIDCDGGRYGPHDIDPLFDPMFLQDTWKKFPHRAFYFHSGEGPNSKVLGFTIINGYQRGPTGDPGVYQYSGGDPVSLFIPIPPCDDPLDCPPYALDGEDADGDGYGGAILCESASSPTIQYCVIRNCTVTGAQGGDGARGQDGLWEHWTLADVDPCTGEIDDVNNELTENTDGQWGGHGGIGTGKGYGGAIACLAGSSPIISDCTITDNFARGGCGGYGGRGGNAAEPPDYGDGLEGAGGDAGASMGDGMGGGIYCDDGSSPTVTNCTFSNDVAATGVRGTGGLRGFGNEDDPRVPEGSDGFVSFIDGIAGGAAYYGTNSDAHFTDCTFTGNKAYEAYQIYFPSPGGDIWYYTAGGALYSVANNTITLDNCKFIGNLGGAVYCDSHCELDFDDCLFAGNSETVNGGALHIGPGGTVDLQSCIFGGNSAYDDGGALKCESNATLTNCSFGNNVADSDNDGWGYGGAMDLYQSGTTLIIDVSACSFSGNQSIYGGGFSSEDFDATFTDCYFIGNTAQEGGGLDLVNGDVSVTGGVVKGNNATDGDGGGFNCRYSIAEIRDCTISDNSADGIYPTGGNGGAIKFYGGAPTQEVFNCLMTGNSATIDGGAVFCYDATPEIGNCTFSENQAGGYGGAIFSDWASNSQITDSIFQNNNSHAIYDQNDAIVTYSLFYDNPDGDYYDSGTGLTYAGAGEIGSIPDGIFNLYGDPLFVSGPLGEFYLNQTLSPAVDNGSVTALSLGLDSYTTDAANAPDSGQVDIGYHYIDIADAKTFQLTTSVIVGQGTIEPETGSYYAGTVVTLTATPGAGWRVKAWSGTDDDSSIAKTNSVVMNSDRTVTVEFEWPRTFIVAVGGGGGFYSNITDALHDAEDGDTIVVYAGIYYGPQILVNKDVEIKSLRPDDPCNVAATIIDSTGHAGPIFWFDPARGPDCILNGFTIQNSNWFTNVGLDGDTGENGADGAGAEGGAIWIGPGASPVIKNCVIQDNSILGGFGGDGAGANGTHNAGRGGWGGWARGGAIYCGTNSSPTFINCQIINNQAVGGLGGDGGDWDPDGGRANYGGNWSRAEWWNIDPRDLTVEWVQGDLWEKWSEMAQPPYGTLEASYYLEDWLTVHWGYFGDYRWYSGYGGAVFINRGSNVTFIDCTISGNLAQGGLSGLGGDEPGGGPLRVKPFPRKYEIPSFGGGVYCAADTTVTFNGCTITDNMASDPSYDHTPDAEAHDEGDRIEDEYEPNNPYSIDPYLGHGGGVCAEDTATVIFTDCTFSENEAAVGGGIHFADANPVISNCNFISNSAFHGGGLFGEHGPATITGCNITNNEAVSDPNDPNVVILGAGGGLHLWATEADINDCYFSGNQAEASGGGVFFGGEGTPSLTNCLITNNTAGRDGAGVSTNIFSQLTISNCTIADNVVTGDGFDTRYGGGLYCSYDSYTNIINSIIWGNLAASGSQLAIGTGFEYDLAPSVVDIYYSDIGPLGIIGGEPGIEVEDYVIYSSYDTSADHSTPGTYGLYGWVGSDGINRIIHYNGSTAYIHTVTIPEGAEPHAHPNNPDVTGPIAPRTFTLERTFDLEVTLSHQSEFYVDPVNNEIYLGAEEGIRTYVFDPNVNNYVFDSQIAPAAPFDGSYYTQTLAYDPDNDIWYAGAIAWNIEPGVTEREVYMYDGTQGPNDTWELAFTYTTEEGIDPMCHHDGMEFINGYLFLADYTGEYIKQYTLGGALVNTYYHPPLGHELEGMGFGALDHFWVGSHGNTITEFGGGALQRGIYGLGPPIHVEEGCTLNGWDWNPGSNNWDPNSYNIIEDPLFIAGYYLSQIAAGQLVDSNCVDAGSDLAANLGLDTYTTRTDGVPDGNVQPLVEYLFDTDASDTSGYGYHGILGGDAVVSGGVLAMSGAGYMDLPALFGAVNPFDGSGDFTIQMDFKTTGPAILISSSKEFPADTPSWDNAMAVYAAEVYEPSEVVYDNCWVGWMGSGTHPIFDSQWHHMVTIYDAETLVHHLYVDGVPESWAEPEDAAWDPNIPNIAEDTVRIGSTYNPDVYVSGGSDFIGDIDNVRIIPDDSVIVDMGYHYPLFDVPQYQLTVTAIEVSELPEEEQPVVDPNYGLYNWYTTVTLTVTTPVPDGYQVLWTGTDNDDSNEPSNTVTMDSDKVVTVTFVKDAYDLTVEVIGPGGSVSPIGTHTYPRGTVVNLTAYPDEDYRFKQWTGTDNDASTATTNTVTMFSDRIVTVEFELPATFTVPGDYPTIQEAIVAARDHDKIIIASGVYTPTNNVGFIIDKEIMLTSTNPDDPNVVALTVINPLNRAFFFTSNAGPGAILNGITIADGGFGAIPAEDGDDPGENGQDGFGTEGGAIYISTGSSPTIKNCIITGFNLFGGDAGSGADANEGFPGGRGGWAGWARGGGVYIASNSSPTFINCTISNCTATGGNAGDGANGAEGEDPDWVQPPGYGGNWSDGILWQLWGYIGDYRYYSAYGGGVYCAQNSSPTFIACTITGNSTQGGMSGVGGLTAVTELITNPAISYEIPSYGGGVYCGAGSTVVFEGCTITNNEALKPGVDEADEVVYHLDPYLGHGGGIAFEETASIIFEEYVSPITGEVRRCVISGNVASVGGGMYWANAAPEIADCNVSDNLAYQGGGLFGTNGSAIIENCIIQNNFAGTAPNDVDEVAGQGGGIYSASMAAEIVDCNISDNEAGASGGGMFFTGVADSPIVINCLVTDNLAGRDGGGISVNWYSEPIIANCTVVGNEATGDFGEFGNTGFGGGLYCSYHSNSEVIDSIFWNNSAIEGDEIAVGTGFEFDPRPATLIVSYSDIQGGRPALLLDTGCTLLWDVDPGDPDYPTNINADPLFATTGPAGDYYLSQTDAGQAQNSPCVDTGSDLASNLGMNLYTTRTDEVPDRSIVDMGYHYPLRVELCSFCDLVPVRDGIINFADLAILVSHWLVDDCFDDNAWCDGADLTFDGNVDFTDYAIFAECWFVEDTKAPEPDPSVWEIEPHSTSTTSINMTAETSFDTWWGSDVQYYFEFVTDDVNSGWRDEPNWPHTISFDPNAEYGYRVRARDRSSRIPDDGTGEPGNKTGWSAIRYVIPGEVGAAGPPTWLPYVATPNSITVEVTTSDSNGIGYAEYYFDEISGNPGGSDSGWQNEPNYTDTGLDPNTTYTYRVRAIDVNDKTTTWSVPLDATTSASGEEDTTPPTPDPATWETEPYATSFTSILMVATTAEDLSGVVEYYFDCTSNPLYSSNPDPDIYQDSPIYSVDGLPEGMYTFVVRVRDAYLNTTGDSDAVTVDLEPPTPNPMEWAEGDEPEEVWGTAGPSDYYAQMTAVVATDPSGVQYNFICTTVPGHSSGWQPSNTYTKHVGFPGQALMFYVIARDLSPNQNETAPSSPPVAAIPR